MLNVLSIVSYPFLPAKMGGQKGIALFNRFFAASVNLTCITTKNNEPGLNEGYTVKNMLSNSKMRYINLFYFFTIRNEIRKNKITHLILEHPYYGWLGIMLKRFCKIRLIVHSHNIEALRFKSTGKWWWRILWKYEQWVYKNADSCFFITEEDKNYAFAQFGLDHTKCNTITYGFELNQAPATEEKTVARDFLNSRYGLDKNETLLLFNGTLDYPPNLNAVDLILHRINPVLMAHPEFNYRIIICGKNLPESYKELKMQIDGNTADWFNRNGEGDNDHYTQAGWLFNKAMNR